MENMFENAKFGDRYRTRDGKLAIFVNRATRHTVTLLTEKFGPEHYRSDGSNVYDRESDIVGRWEEQNNEESLNAYLDEFQSKNPSYEVISVNVTSNYITVTYKDTSQNCQVDGESREALSKNKEMEQLRQQLADLQLRALQEQVELQFRL